MPSILRITNGTTEKTIQLVVTESGIHVRIWSPKNAPAKDGGVWLESPYTDGSRPVFMRYENVVEVFNIDFSLQSPPLVGDEINKLLNILKEALDYWLDDWQLADLSTPFWLEYQSEMSTTILYAYILGFNFPEINDPFEKTLMECPTTMDAISLEIAHTPWQDISPISSPAAVDVYGYNIANYGETTPLATARRVVSWETFKNIDTVFRFDASVPSYTDITAGPFPVNLFPFPLGVGDILYMGSEVPYVNACWNLLLNGTGSNVDLIMEYFNGAIWTLTRGITTYDFFMFTGTVGKTFWCWYRENNWAANAVNAVTRYWQRLRVNAIVVPGADVPQQQDQRIYACNWSHWEVNNTEIQGTKEALLKLLLRFQYSTNPGTGNPNAEYNRFLMAWRSVSRGSNFSPYLPVRTGYGSPAVTFTAGGAAGISTVTTSESPYGQRINYTVAIATAEVLLSTWTITPNDYRGRFRFLVRIQTTVGGIGSLGFRYTVEIDGVGVAISPNEVVYNEHTLGYAVIDMGELNLQSESGKPFNLLRLQLYVRTTAASTFNLYDGIVMPNDENILEGYLPISGNYFTNDATARLLHDSTKPKEGPTTEQIILASNTIKSPLQTKMLGHLHIKQRKQSRIYTLCWHDTTATGLLAGFDGAFDTGMSKIQRFDLGTGSI